MQIKSVRRSVVTVWKTLFGKVFVAVLRAYILPPILGEQELRYSRLPGNVTAVQRNNPAAGCERHPRNIEQVSSGYIIEMMQGVVGHYGVEVLELADEVLRDVFNNETFRASKSAMRALDVP